MGDGDFQARHPRRSLQSVDEYYFSMGGTMAAGVAGPTAVVGLGVALTNFPSYSLSSTSPPINVRVNGRYNTYSAVVTASVPGPPSTPNSDYTGSP